MYCITDNVEREWPTDRRTSALACVHIPIPLASRAGTQEARTTSPATYHLQQETVVRAVDVRVPLGGYMYSHDSSDSNPRFYDLMLAGGNKSLGLYCMVC